MSASASRDDQQPNTTPNQNQTNKPKKQVAFADKILLNKIDLVDAEAKKQLTRQIRSINKGAPILECTHAKVDLADLLGIRAFSLDRLLASDPDFLDEGGADGGGQEAEPGGLLGGGGRKDHGHLMGGRRKGVMTVIWVPDR